MNIYDPYPDRVTVDGKTYRLDLRWDNVLRAMDAQANDALSQRDRLTVMLTLLLKHKPPKDGATCARILREIMELFPHSDKPQTRYIDFHQDAKLIRSAFLRMGYDLSTSRMHFFQFLELLGDSPDDTALARVIDIRRRPIPEPNKHNGKMIAALMEAKSKVAIRLPEEEQRRMFAESLKQSNVLRG